MNFKVRKEGGLNKWGVSSWFSLFCASADYRKKKTGHCFLVLLVSFVASIFSFNAQAFKFYTAMPPFFFSLNVCN